MQFRATHKFNGVDQLNGDTHPMKGIECQLIRKMGMSHAGYNCVVHANLEETCQAYAKNDPKSWRGGAEQVKEFFRSQGWIVGQFVEMEANLEEELAPVV